MSNSPGTLPPAPPSFEKRLPLALGLMMLVLLASQYFFKPAPGPKPVSTPKNDKVNGALVTQAPIAAPLPETSASTGSVSAAAVTLTTVDTDLYRIEFSNQGGVIKSWVLKKYQDDAGKPLQLINTAVPADKDLPAPFSIELNGQSLPFDPNKVLYLARVSDGGLAIDYSYSDGRAAVHKQFTFRQNSYLADVKSSVLLNGTPVPHFLTWRGGFGEGP
jgi:YidC/Oxa1 family membrane protein insertase